MLVPVVDIGGVVVRVGLGWVLVRIGVAAGS